MTTADRIDVIAPLIVGVLATVALFRVLSRRRHGVTPWFELGAVYSAVVTLYLVYPLVGFLALDGAYTPLNDRRLRLLHPTAAEVGRIGWVYAAHLSAFALAYVLRRGRLPAHGRALRGPRRTVVLATAATFTLVTVFELFIRAFFDTAATTYAGTYLAARRLPLFVAQVANHVTGAKFVLSVILLAALFWRYGKYRLVIAAWLIAISALTAVRLGSRTDVVLLLLAAAMMYHLLVRPLPPRVVLAIAGAGLSGFIALGIVRGLSGGATGKSSPNPFRYSSEFETVFANAVHLNRVKHTIGGLSIAFYLADLTALVPQQVAPFPKIDRAEWYVSTFFPEYAAVGGGLAFGAGSEAILAGGWIAAVMLGGALGLCFAQVHRFYARRADRFWVFVMYVWVTTLSYQAFRNTTFSLLVLFVYRFVPVFVTVNLLASNIGRLSGGPGHDDTSALTNSIQRAGT
jgi:oligosaccharide repeat unit polymerase